VRAKPNGATRTAGAGTRRHSNGSLELQLLGRFAVFCEGEALTVAPTGQRLLAGIALQGRTAHRARLSETLWPDRAPDRAVANLRCAIWRMPAEVRSSLDKQGLSVALSPRWHIDVDAVTESARHLRVGDANNVHRSLFASDLLPDWDDSWLVIRRERHRQLRLHALEDLAARQLACGAALDAVDTALDAVATEPLRESAQILLLRAHLAAGNRATARHQFEQFRTLLAVELRVEPSTEMQLLFES
jgi:DNA-binding SARP family transcriptional activator